MSCTTFNIVFRRAGARLFGREAERRARHLQRGGLLSVSSRLLPLALVLITGLGWYSALIALSDRSGGGDAGFLPV